MSSPTTIDQQLQSGEWHGHYVQFGNSTEQKMVLEFADGLIRGDGIDRVSPFDIEGEFRSTDDEIRVAWIKRYQHGHSILYCGLLKNGVISGDWDMLGFGSGTFELNFHR